MTALRKPADTNPGAVDPSAAGGAHPLLRSAPKTLAFNKLRKRLLRQTRQALADYSMVRPGGGSGERWLVAVSGGKDSFALLTILFDLKWQGLLPVDLLACNLDQGQPNFPKTVLPDFFKAHDVPHRIDYRDTYSIVTEKIPATRTYCSLCSRLRRGNLYRIAREEGCSAVVLGHHREDILETFFLNLVYGGRLSTMPPKLLNDDGDVEILRPLALCAEDDLGKFAGHLNVPIIPCDLCGSQDGLQRNAIKAMLAEMESRTPGRKEIMLRAMAHVRPSHLLDTSLFDFSTGAASERDHR